MAGINTLSVTLSAGVSTWNAQNNLTGSNYNPLTNVGAFNQQQSYVQSTANAALGGADEFVSYLISLAASANTTVNLCSLTNILQQTGVNLARVKGWCIRLLNAAQDSVNGTTCTSVTVGNAAANQFLFNNLTANATFSVYTGSISEYFDQTAGGFTVANASNNNIKLVNADATNAAAVQLTLVGGQS